MVGYSAKPEGRAALRRAIAEAKLRSSRLIVVHTSPEIEVAELATELASSGVPYEVAAPADNLDPAEELIAAADRTDAEFIVIGLRRRSPVGKLLLGSNAQRVLLDASLPRAGGQGRGALTRSVAVPACAHVRSETGRHARRTGDVRAGSEPQGLRRSVKSLIGVPECPVEHLLTSDGRCLP